MNMICTVHKKVCQEQMSKDRNKVEFFCPECEIDQLKKDEDYRYNLAINERKRNMKYGLFSLFAAIIGLFFLQDFYHHIWYWAPLLILLMTGFGSFAEYFSKPQQKSYEEIKKENEYEFRKRKTAVDEFKANKFKEYQKEVADISVIDSFGGFEFEEYVADLLRKLGYKNVRVTKRTGDKGVDILAEKSSRKYAIQCKRINPRNKLSNSAIQQVYTGKQLYKCSNAMVITTSYFTEPAWNAAKELGVTLWARNTLIEKINQVATPYLTFEQYLEPYYENANKVSETIYL